MSTTFVENNAKSLTLTRTSDSSSLADGGTYIAGESISVSASGAGVLEANTDSFSSCTFSTHGWTRKASSSGTAIAPTSGTFVVKAVWCTGQTSCYIKSVSLTLFSTLPPTSLPTLPPSIIPGSPTQLPNPTPTMLPTASLRPSMAPSVSPTMMPLVVTGAPTSAPVVAVVAATTHAHDHDHDHDSVSAASATPGTLAIGAIGAAILFAAPVVAYYSFTRAMAVSDALTGAGDGGSPLGSAVQLTTKVPVNHIGYADV
eukprot:CAMPEP_0171809634 /NCGR_PEP_ID=MMETSP0991-20121206/77052_1 /TAXON_ID=483369 /ORGANISM="non described non described, Strain CCMP2098" /LENGTH=257 /DNA_ID=CAMNT_0012422693 /DNA_START=89 /DNA_END=862 /DNA_ORIENTATION=-